MRELLWLYAFKVLFKVRDNRGKINLVYVGEFIG
jgi:hypothetical protein